MPGEKQTYYTLDPENSTLLLSENEVRTVEAQSSDIELSEAELGKLALCRVERKIECLQPDDCSRLTCWRYKMGWQ